MGDALGFCILCCPTPTPPPHRVLTPKEVMLAGLEKGDRLPFFIKNVKGKGRGVFCKDDIPAKTFLCEYKTSRIYPSARRRAAEAEYGKNNEGSYIMDGGCINTKTGVATRMSFDATRRVDQVVWSPL